MSNGQTGTTGASPEYDFLEELVTISAALSGLEMPGSFGEEELPDPLDMWTYGYGIRLDDPLVSHTVHHEAVPIEEWTTAPIPPMGPPGVGEGQDPAEFQERDEFIVDTTVRDVVQAYVDAPPEEQLSIRERLFAGGHYRSGVDGHEISDHPRDTRSALADAMIHYGAMNMNPLVALPAADRAQFVEEPAPGPRRATEAQIVGMADQMARSLLGRRATEPERRAAVAIGRRFEDQGQSYGARDFEAPYRFVAGDEVKARDMEKTLSVFERIVKGR
ncbi:hypothetical protein CMI37_31575 [Candidatus Pacearchaeota archaeon]|nr:hypothetical protein [Candidatus Pacearchaeota archaeon]